MSADPARLLELIAECSSDLEALERAAGEIAALRSRVPEPAEGAPEVILYGYHLHRWCGAAEGLLGRIAEYFENAADRGELDRRLLKRLKLDVPGLRPPVIGDATFEHLNALRAFRHVFLHTHDHSLTWRLTRPNVLRLADAHQAFTADAESFISYLRGLTEAV